MHSWRGISTLLFFAALPVAGCALIAGVDQYKKGQCPGDCDGSVAPHDAAVDTSPDTSLVDAANDVQPLPDSGGDAADGGANDASPDGGCGPTNTVQNCSQCGAVCDQTNASNAACNGTTCLYTCKMGFSNCSNGAPDLNGCECATPSCCGAQCATEHANGIGQNFYDCVAQKTYDQTQATEACTAYTSNQNACLLYQCDLGDAGKDELVCGLSGNVCACWTYLGLYVGHVHKSADSSCFCPTSNDATWN